VYNGVLEVGRNLGLRFCCAFSLIRRRSVVIATVRSTAKKILGPKVTAYIRSLRIKNLPSSGKYREHLRGRSALEIGGPSEIFALGPLPIYGVLRSVDNCNYAAQTLWRPAGFGPHYRQVFICEANSLNDISDRRYECVLSSHSLEHIANPLKALYGWRRVLTDDGLLLLILPHKKHTFDWRRPVTTLDHMVSDYQNQTTEDDLTHVDEILKLHDLSRDLPAGTPEQFRARSLNNLAVRALHHHVFTLDSAMELLKYAGFSPILSEVALPIHMIILARRNG
jgi:SAM-dependent methyltransferase